MANNFAQADATLSNNNLTTVVSTTSNKQIVIGLLISNTGTASINVDAVLNDGSNDRYIIKNAPPKHVTISLRNEISILNSI